jgi:hypothetical protein
VKTIQTYFHTIQPYFYTNTTSFTYVFIAKKASNVISTLVIVLSTLGFFLWCTDYHSFGSVLFKGKRNKKKLGFWVKFWDILRILEDIYWTIPARYTFLLSRFAWKFQLSRLVTGFHKTSWSIVISHQKHLLGLCLTFSP